MCALNILDLNYYNKKLKLKQYPNLIFLKKLSVFVSAPVNKILSLQYRVRHSIAQHL